MSPSWARAAAEIISRIDEDDLPKQVVAALATLVRFDLACVFVYRERTNPIHVFDTFPDRKSRQGLINYTTSTYVLNPFYNAYLRGLKTGVYRMRNLAPDAYFKSEYFKNYKAKITRSEEIGYITQDWPPGMQEVCLALELLRGELIEVSLSQPAGKDRFSDYDVRALDAVIPFLAAVFNRYWKRHRSRFVASSPEASLDDAFSRFGGSILSPREREITQLLLRGHSTVSISMQLGISTTTVKTHRKHLYEKLGISTHYELFSRFLDSLHSAPH